jgi:hypothetical protein
MRTFQYFRLNPTLQILTRLEQNGVIRENMPAESFWRWEVIRPDELPTAFRPSYEQHNEIRFYWT